MLRHLLPVLLSSTALLAADWPQRGGPDRNNISAETSWQTEWSGNGPKELWTAEIGLGFSSFVVSDGRVFTTGHADGHDTVFCLDAATGKEKWKHSYPADLGDKFYEGGTSATPTVDGAHVYHLSRWGDLFCFDAASGKVAWQTNIQKDTGANIPDWGYAGSPLVHGKLLILNVGKAGCAVDKATGKVVWKSAEDNAGYSTPLPWKRGDKTLVLIGSGASYVAVDADTGAPAWEFPWTTKYGVNATEPIITGNQVFISTGYNKGCVLLKVDGNTPVALWQNKGLRCQFSNPVLIGGHIYGIDNDQNTRASLRCLDLATGAMKWKDESVGFGSLMAAGDTLLILTSKGELVSARASADKLDVISRAKVVDGKCWAQPVLANGRVYIRNSEGHVVCLDVRGK